MLIISVYVGLVLFTLASMSMYLMAAFIDGSLHLPYSVAISIFPALVFLGVCKYIRRHLHTIWDVCLVCIFNFGFYLLLQWCNQFESVFVIQVIRPARDVSFSNVSILHTLRKKLSRG